MASALNNPNFWSDEAKTYGFLKQDGSLKYILLDKKFKMIPLIKKMKTTFTQFIANDPQAKACKVVVNGNFYDATLYAKFLAATHNPDDPSSTLIQGQIVENGRVVAGDSRPLSFWFGQVAAATKDPWSWTYTAGSGNPPATQTTISAIGGVEPLIVNTLPFGTANRYKPGAGPKIKEPTSGEPPPEARSYLIQRSNAAFVAVNKLHPATGKTILAYCSLKRTILVAVQQHGSAPGQTHSTITEALAHQGFDVAVFLDGSDSATLVVDGSLVISPADRKNELNDVGIGFRL